MLVSFCGMILLAKCESDLVRTWIASSGSALDVICRRRIAISASSSSSSCLRPCRHSSLPLGGSNTTTNLRHSTHHLNLPSANHAQVLMPLRHRPSREVLIVSPQWNVLVSSDEFDESRFDDSDVGPTSRISVIVSHSWIFYVSVQQCACNPRQLHDVVA